MTLPETVRACYFSHVGGVKIAMFSVLLSWVMLITHDLLDHEEGPA